MWRTFADTYGNVASFLALCLAIITFFIVPESSLIHSKYVAVAGIVAAFLLLLFVTAAWRAFDSAAGSLPSVRCGVVPRVPYEEALVHELAVEPAGRLASIDLVETPRPFGAGRFGPRCARGSTAACS